MKLLLELIIIGIVGLSLGTNIRQSREIDSLRSQYIATDIVDMLQANQYLVFETYPDPENTSDRNLFGQLYYEGPIADNPTKDTIIDLHYFNSVDLYPDADDISATWYTVD